MTIRFYLSISLLAASLLVAAFARAEDTSSLRPDHAEIYGEIEIEGTGFFESPQFAEQTHSGASLAGEFTVLSEWSDGDIAFKFTPFGRIDSQDDARTHVDIRELKIDVTEGPWSATFGVDTVFWGKTEVVHLVDIINQTDQVEAIDDEARLGQPMLRVGYLTDFGEFSAFYMPYFRERTFPGAEGRLRLDPAVDTDNPIYDTGAEEWTPSFAGRFSGVFADVDLGLSAFHGIGRDPSFVPVGTSLRPVYERITQTGLDVQYTSDATLYKLEAIWRGGQRNALGLEEDFVAATGGLEHTLFGFADTNADVGLLVEYAWDSRQDEALTTFQNDLFGGIRLALNNEDDTTMLLTGSVDTTDGSMSARLEGETRLTSNISAAIEAQGFFDRASGAARSPFADDSFVRLKVKYFFGQEVSWE